MSWKFELGAKVTSIHSGFKGYINSRQEHLNGCRRYSVQPPVDLLGKLPEGYWLDENEIKLLPEEKPIPHKEVTTGGPMTKSTMDKC